MKALVLTDPGRFSYVDAPIPDVGDDDVLVRIEACGICGSDVHGMDGRSGRRIPPIVMGHEAAGVIEAVGSAVVDWEAGRSVTFDSTVFCGHCPYCRAGRVNLCDERRVLGVSCRDYRRPGAFAEQLVVPARGLHALPPGVSMVEATLAEPLAVAAHAVSRATLDETSSVIVVGTGVIGMLIIQVLRATGVRHITAVDLSPSRLARAQGMGADATFVAGDDTAARLAAIDDSGPDVAFDAVGIESTVTLATTAVRKGGTVVLVGNLAPTVNVGLQWAVTRELTLAGSAASSGEIPQALELIASGGVDVSALVSAVAPLSEGATWFDRLREPGTELVKVVLEP